MILNELQGFSPIAIEDIKDNAVKLFNEDWCLLTAGAGDKHNAMTISWGNLGELWYEPVVTVYVRQQRHTKLFLDDNKHFTVSAFGPEFKKLLNYFGTVSGRDEDKIAKSGLKTSLSPNGSLIFDDARLIIECEKLYAQDMTPENFIDKTILDRFYNPQSSNGSLHTLYIGKVVNVWVKA